MALELMPFQAEGANYLSRSKRALLIWDAGVGKTPTAVRAAVRTGAKRVLVFCPPIAVSVWRQHFRDWSNLDPLIIPYSTAHKAWVLDGAPAEVVIMDEIHYLKNPNAQRTRAVYGDDIDLKGTHSERAEHIWGLSGTPLLNHAGEFWTHLHALRPDLIHLGNIGVMDEAHFVDRFCVTQAFKHGVRIVGSKNATELADRVRPIVNRKRMKDVLKDMPELRIVEHPLPTDTVIEQALRQELADAVEVAGFAPDDFNELDDDELLGMVQAGSVGFSTVRRLIGKAKVEGVTALVNDFMADDPDSKLIVFAHHRQVISALAEDLKAHAPLVITGETPMKARDKSIATFQQDRGFRLIILAIEAAGEVITLHASHNVIIAEPSPVPAKNYQAIARAHRKGQKHPVLARFVLLPGTLDARLMSIIARKTRDIAQIVDGAAPVNAPRVSDAFPDGA